MDFDIIESLASNAIQAVQKADFKTALSCLGEIKGHANALMTISTMWELIREDYEAGVSPREIALKYRQYNITRKEVYNKAYSLKWASPKKIQKSYKPDSKKKNIFYPKCRECEKPFEAYSGHAIICPTCKAFVALKNKTP